MRLADIYGTTHFGTTFAQLRSRLKQSVAPSVEPVTIIEAKHLDKVEHRDDDSLWTGWVKSARQQIEGDTSRAFITQTWQLYLDQFPAWEIELRICPVQSVSSIAYVEPGGTTVTLDSSLYSVDLASEPARITPAWGHVWPSVRNQANAVLITFVAGYGATADLVPEFCKDPIRNLAAFWNRNRQMVGQQPPYYESLINPLKWGDYR